MYSTFPALVPSSARAAAARGPPPAKFYTDARDTGLVARHSLLASVRGRVLRRAVHRLATLQAMRMGQTAHTSADLQAALAWSNCYRTE